MAMNEEQIKVLGYAHILLGKRLCTQWKAKIFSCKFRRVSLMAVSGQEIGVEQDWNYGFLTDSYT